MTEMTYASLINTTLELYFKQNYLEAYNFITENAAKVKGSDAHIYNFRYCMASKAGLCDLGVQIMREAIVEKGFWYSYDYLMGDDDLKSLHEYKDFHELADICKVRQVQAKRDSKPELKVLMPDKSAVDKERYSLMIALHGNGQNALIAEEHWNSCVADGRMLALPQSSQSDFTGAYSWNDIEKAAKELGEHYINILECYNADTEDVIIGGFSAGCRLSLYAVLNDIIQAKGFILVGPWLPEIQEWEHLLDRLKSKGTRCCIICGDRDELCFEVANKFVDMLSKRDIPHIYKVVEGLNHNYPADFREELREAVRFITK